MRQLYLSPEKCALILRSRGYVISHGINLSKYSLLVITHEEGFSSNFMPLARYFTKKKVMNIMVVKTHSAY